MRREQAVALVDDPPMRVGIRLIGIVALGYAVTNRLATSSVDRVPGAMLAVVAFVSVVCVLFVRMSPVVRICAIAILAVTAGLTGILSSWMTILLVVAGISAGTAIDQGIALPVVLLGPAALLIAMPFDHRGSGLVLGSAVAALGGLAGGISRRQATERSQQHAVVALERERTAVEHERAELLEERNRIAREVHDVLAHTLGALSIQLEAVDAYLESMPDQPRELETMLRRSRALVVDGLGEAHAAVRVLRDAPVDLVDRIGELASGDQATLAISGTPRVLGAAAGVALLRAAQEAVTNAQRHAPGAPVTIELVFAAGSTTVRVTNGAPTRSAPVGAPGFGLQGMRERVELAGGVVTVGEEGPGWAVVATVPA